jgi:hypothetical protein
VEAEGRAVDSSIGIENKSCVSAKTATTFTVRSSNAASTALVDWIVRY